MARPLRNDARAAILDGLDEKPISSISDIANHLKKVNKYYSDQATRRMLNRMRNEGLIYELPKRGEFGRIYYTKLMMPNVARLVTPTGNNVSLRVFIHELIEFKDARSVLSDDALTAIKVWMLEVLGSSIGEAYEDKHREVPDEYELRTKLKEVQTMLSQYHKFIQNFLNADIWSEYARENLAKEFRDSCVEEHAGIVDRSWLNEGN